MLSRQRDSLSWSHHAAVAALPAEVGDDLLSRAAAEGWSREAHLAAEVARLRHRLSAPGLADRVRVRLDAERPLAKPLSVLYICRMQPDQFAHVVRERLTETGQSLHGAAVSNGLPRDAIRRVLGDHIPRLDRAADICAALGLEFYIGPPRGGARGEALKLDARDSDGGSLPASSVRDLESSAQTLNRVVTAAGGDPIPDDLWPVLAERRGVGASASGLADLGLADPSALAVGAANEDAIPPGARPVDVVELAAAAGGGAEAADERVAGRIWFARAWLDSRGLDATRCAVIGVRGDSMNPTLPEGCSILVDRSRTRRRPGRIYVVRVDDSLVVKRAAREASRWLLASDNDAPGYAPIPWPADAETIGEVRWMAQSFR